MLLAPFCLDNCCVRSVVSVVSWFNISADMVRSFYFILIVWVCVCLAVGPGTKPKKKKKLLGEPISVTVPDSFRSSDIATCSVNFAPVSDCVASWFASPYNDPTVCFSTVVWLRRHFFC